MGQTKLIDGKKHCQLCGREVEHITKHHLIPRARHKNKRNKRLFSREDVKTKIIDVCRPCHKNIHVTFTNKELGSQYNTLKALKTSPGIKKFSDWVAKIPSEKHIRVKPRSLS